MDKKFMIEALKQAKIAEKKDEVPVGAVVVLNGKVIAKARNKRHNKKDVTLHAEIIAIKKACKKLKRWRLENCDIYITLEPCAMCAGAIVAARIKNVYFGAFEKKGGCAGSVFNLLNEPKFNHRCNIKSGILEEECSNILTNYFKSKRKRRN